MGLTKKAELLDSRPATALLPPFLSSCWRVPQKFIYFFPFLDILYPSKLASMCAEHCSHRKPNNWVKSPAPRSLLCFGGEQRYILASKGEIAIMKARKGRLYEAVQEANDKIPNLEMEMIRAELDRLK